MIPHITPKASSVKLLTDTVVKSFALPEAYHREWNVYRLKLDVCPRMISWLEPDSITIQRVPGQPYLDFGADMDVTGLADTIASFHLATYDGHGCLCHIDNQPGNILYDGSRHYLIDFSDAALAPPEMDISHLLLFWASEFPPDVFARLCQAFLRQYRLRIPIYSHLWQECLSASIARFDARRAMFRPDRGAPAQGFAIPNRDILKIPFQS